MSQIKNYTTNQILYISRDLCCLHIVQLLFIQLMAVKPFRTWYRVQEFEGEDVEVELVFSRALCERGFVPKWCEEEEMDRERGRGGR